MFANMVKLSEVLSSLKTYKIKKLRKPNSSYERLVIGYKLFAFTIIIENNLKLHIILDCTPHLPGWPAFLLRQCRLGSSNCIAQHRKDIYYFFFSDPKLVFIFIWWQWNLFFLFHKITWYMYSSNFYCFLHVSGLLMFTIGLTSY